MSTPIAYTVKFDSTKTGTARCGRKRLPGQWVVVEESPARYQSNEVADCYRWIESQIRERPPKPSRV